MQKILGALFKPLPNAGSAMAIEVFAERMPIDGAQLFARVGNQPVRFLLPIIGGRGFTGVLRQAPQNGERLYLRYSGRIEHKTDVVYRGGGGNQNVA